MAQYIKTSWVKKSEKKNQKAVHGCEFVRNAQCSILVAEGYRILKIAFIRLAVVMSSSPCLVVKPTPIRNPQL